MTDTSLRILFVDDDEDMCTMTAAALAKHGLSVDWCTTGDQALERLVGAKFDAVVTDLGLKGKGPSGLDLCRTMSRNYPDCPVVVLTGDAQARAAAMRAGARGFVVKPASMAELAQSVKSVLEASATAAS